LGVSSSLHRFALLLLLLVDIDIDIDINIDDVVVVVFVSAQWRRRGWRSRMGRGCSC
jgi:hypothetical protein